MSDRTCSVAVIAVRVESRQRGIVTPSGCGISSTRRDATYTQLSSEVGVPGLLFYLGALWYSLRISFSTYRRLRREPDRTREANIAYAVFLTLFVFAVAAPFASLAYHFFFPVFAGLAVGLEYSTRQFQSAPSAERAQTGLGVSTLRPSARRER